MKKTILLLITIIPFICLAQVNLGIGAGIDIKGHDPVVNTYIGYSYQNVFITAEIRPAATRTAFKNNYLGGKIGYDLSNSERYSIIPSIGYYYNKISSDKRELNNFKLGYSVKGILYLKDRNGIFAETFYSDRLQFCIGMHVTLN